METCKFSINSITCDKEKDAKGNAEIWLLAQLDGEEAKRYPVEPKKTFSLSEGKTWDINGDLTFEFSRSCNLTIYELDFDIDISATDYMGNALFLTTDPTSGTKIATNGSNSSDNEYSKFTISYTRIY